MDKFPGGILQRRKIKKILKLSLLISLLLASIYLLYLSSNQDYSVLSPIRNQGSSADNYEEGPEDYMNFINKPPITID